MDAVRFFVGPELYAVQDKVQGFALHPTECRAYPLSSIERFESSICTVRACLL
jgi:hypothetical protein